METEKRYNVIYVGSMEKIAEYIFFHPLLSLAGILCESNRVSDDLFTYSLVRKVPLYRVENQSDIIATVKQMGDGMVYLMCSFGKRIPIEKIEYGMWYNIHLAELPAYKGRHPTFWATVRGENFIGISLHEVSENFDCGSIVAQEKVPYFFWEDESVLFNKLVQKVPLLLDRFVQYLNGGREMIENTEGEYYPPVEKMTKTINLKTDSVDYIFQLVRSQTRAGGANICIDGREFVLYKIRFTQCNMESDYEEKEDALYIKYQDGICLKSECYEEVRK